LGEQFSKFGKPLPKDLNTVELGSKKTKTKQNKKATLFLNGVGV